MLDDFRKPLIHSIKPKQAGENRVKILGPLAHPYITRDKIRTEPIGQFWQNSASLTATIERRIKKALHLFRLPEEMVLSTERGDT